MGLQNTFASCFFEEISNLDVKIVVVVLT